METVMLFLGIVSCKYVIKLANFILFGATIFSFKFHLAIYQQGTFIV